MNQLQLYDNYDHIIIAAAEKYEFQSMLNMDEELLTDIDVNIVPTNTSSSQMILPSISTTDTSDHSNMDVNLIYDSNNKDWTYVSASFADLDPTPLPDVTDNDELNIEQFMELMDAESSSSTQAKQCNVCCVFYNPSDGHFFCEPCPCCKNVVCICGFPPEMCFLCKKTIGSECRCPFDSQ